MFGAPINTLMGAIYFFVPNRYFQNVDKNERIASRVSHLSAINNSIYCAGREDAIFRVVANDSFDNIAQWGKGFLPALKVFENSESHARPFSCGPDIAFARAFPR